MAAATAEVARSPPLPAQAFQGCRHVVWAASATYRETAMVPCAPSRPRREGGRAQNGTAAAAIGTGVDGGS